MTLLGYQKHQVLFVFKHYHKAAWEIYYTSKKMDFSAEGNDVPYYYISIPHLN
jgi:hypothetical protein